MGQEGRSLCYQQMAKPTPNPYTSQRGLLCSAALLLCWYNPCYTSYWTGFRTHQILFFPLTKGQRCGLGWKHCRQPKYLLFFRAENLNEGKGLELVPNDSKAQEIHSFPGDVNDFVQHLLWQNYSLAGVRQTAIQGILCFLCLVYFIYSWKEIVFRVFICHSCCLWLALAINHSAII